jgi:hypothetical protein
VTTLASTTRSLERSRSAYNITHHRQKLFYPIDASLAADRLATKPTANHILISLQEPRQLTLGRPFAEQRKQKKEKAAWLGSRRISSFFFFLPTQME